MVLQITPTVSSMVPMVVSNEQTLEFAARRGVPTGAYAHASMPLFSWSEAGYKGQVSVVWLFQRSGSRTLF